MEGREILVAVAGVAAFLVHLWTVQHALYIALRRFWARDPEARDVKRKVGSWMSTKTARTSATTAESSGTLAARLATLRRSAARLRVTWESAPSELLREVISAIVEEGNLISFSRTSDGGALVLTVLDNQEKSSHYAASQEELDVLLEQIGQMIRHNS